MYYLDKTASLTPFAHRIIVDQATEYPHTGKYNKLARLGSYLCRRCGLALFRSHNQFSSSCGWPSFDDELPLAIKRLLDPDGHRVEIRCARCDGHLGHVFQGEYLTAKNLRHCVNSASLDFVPDEQVLDTEEAIVAGGCFWGVEYYLRQLPGVLLVESGYTGGVLYEPSYEQVCRGRSGHYEAVRVVYDRKRADYQQLIKHFFEIHDPTQITGQGPDLGPQYQSAIFYYNEDQEQLAQALIQRLTSKGYKVATCLLPVQIFWPAEDYHQAYYSKHHKQPYCHTPVLRFD